MYIIFAADHAGFTMKETIKHHFSTLIEKYTLLDASPVYEETDDYPDVALQTMHLLRTIPKAEEYLILAFCGSGEGICMAFNRFQGIRAGLPSNTTSAILLKEHNNANALCFSGRYDTDEHILTLIESFLAASYSAEPRHQRRIEKLDKLV